MQKWWLSSYLLPEDENDYYFNHYSKSDFSDVSNCVIEDTIAPYESILNE